MLGWLLVMDALAGKVFVNGVHVEPSQLAGVRFSDVDVRMDAAGDVHIDAPGYNVRPANTVAPLNPMQGTVATIPSTVVPGPVPSGMSTPSAVQPVAGVTPGMWWLYSEDQGSTGHEVNVLINGVRVATIRSTQPSSIIDLARWLRRGSNTVRFEAISTNPTGGPLYLYIGNGADEQGTVNMGEPSIELGIGRSKQGPTVREYNLEVNR